MLGRDSKAAVGTTKYPSSEYFPPNWDDGNDGNYKVAEDGKADPAQVGVDGIKGTAPVGSFKMNAPGFYDLGGNAAEYMWDGLDEKTGNRVLRGGNWFSSANYARCAYRSNFNPPTAYFSDGFRLARGRP